MGLNFRSAKNQPLKNHFYVTVTLKSSRTSINNLAMARKLAEIYWLVMVKGLQYVESGMKKYEEQLLQRKRQSFIRPAKELNYQVVASEPVCQTCHW